MEKVEQRDIAPRILDLFASLPADVQRAFVTGYDVGSQVAESKQEKTDKE